jgi:hypothetical protein
VPSTPPKDLTFFSGISGPALANAAGPGSMMIKMMDKAGFDRPDAVALTASTTMAWKAVPDILSRSALLTASVFARGDGAGAHLGTRGRQDRGRPDPLCHGGHL